eukprot:gene6748-7843_t
MYQQPPPIPPSDPQAKNKYSKYNISLTLTPEHKVFTLNFVDSDPSSIYSRSATY